MVTFLLAWCLLSALVAWAWSRFWRQSPKLLSYPYPCATGQHVGHRSRMLAEACLRVAEEARMRGPAEQDRQE